MSHNKCDICGEDVLPGQPRRGPPPGPGLERHWLCHVAKHGVPVRSSFADLRAAASGSPAPVPAEPPAPAVKALKASRKGAVNYSDNAAREWRTIGAPVSEMGRRRIKIECPFCLSRFWAFVWSLSGGGKKCPNCGAMHFAGGTAHPTEGNEDL